MESSAIRAYEIFKELNLSPETAKELAEITTASRDEHLEKWVASKEDVASVKLELKEDMLRMEARLEGGMARLETSFAKAQNSTVKWFIAVAGAMIGIVFAMMKLMQ